MVTGILKGIESMVVEAYIIGSSENGTKLQEVDLHVLSSRKHCQHSICMHKIAKFNFKAG